MSFPQLVCIGEKRGEEAKWPIFCFSCGAFPGGREMSQDQHVPSQLGNVVVQTSEGFHSGGGHGFAKCVFQEGVPDCQDQRRLRRSKLLVGTKHEMILIIDSVAKGQCLSARHVTDLNFCAGRTPWANL